MAAASMKLIGVASVRRRLLAVKKSGARAIKAGLQDLGAQITARAQGYTPVESGALRDSIAPTLPAEDRSFLSITVTAGDAATEAYAIRQHEDLSLQHPHGGGPKFLERAMLDFGSPGTGGQIVGAKLRAGMA
jgi:hypothetical protein